MRYQLVPNGNAGYPANFDIIDTELSGLFTTAFTVPFRYAKTVVDALNAAEERTKKDGEKG